MSSRQTLNKTSHRRENFQCESPERPPICAHQGAEGGRGADVRALCACSEDGAGPDCGILHPCHRPRSKRRCCPRRSRSGCPGIHIARRHCWVGWREIPPFAQKGLTNSAGKCAPGKSHSPRCRAARWLLGAGNVAQGLRQLRLAPGCSPAAPRTAHTHAGVTWPCIIKRRTQRFKNSAGRKLLSLVTMPACVITQDDLR